MQWNVQNERAELGLETSQAAQTLFVIYECDSIALHLEPF